VIDKKNAGPHLKRLSIFGKKTKRGLFGGKGGSERPSSPTWGRGKKPGGRIKKKGPGPPEKRGRDGPDKKRSEHRPGRLRRASHHKKKAYPNKGRQKDIPNGRSPKKMSRTETLEKRKIRWPLALQGQKRAPAGRKSAQKPSKSRPVSLRKRKPQRKREKGPAHHAR